MPLGKTFDSITRTIANTPMVQLRRVIPADLSFAYKDEASVQYKREWFDVDADGSWVFRKEFAQPLFRQFVKLMSSNQHFTR